LKQAGFEQCTVLRMCKRICAYLKMFLSSQKNVGNTPVAVSIYTLFKRWCVSGPTPIRPNAHPTLLARGFTAARWTSGRNAQPPSLS
jgi:hypothetical protein